MRILILILLFLLGFVAYLSVSRGGEVVVVLTFDYEDMSNAKGTEMIPAILRVLEKHNATATFFILGKTAKMHPETVRLIASKNHTIGMHTYFHNLPIFSKADAALIGEIYGYDEETEWRRSFKTEEAFIEDTERCRRELERITGRTPRIFRSPSIVVNWVKNDAYFRALHMAGVLIDSSVYQGGDAWLKIDGVIEVPITCGEEAFKYDPRAILLIAEHNKRRGLPVVVSIHPARLETSDVLALDEALTLLEKEYHVRYAKLEEVPELFR